MANRPQKSAAKANKSARPVRPPISFEAARLLCPDDAQAANVAAAFGLSVPDYLGIRATHEKALRETWLAFDEALNEKATQMASSASSEPTFLPPRPPDVSIPRN